MNDDFVDIVDIDADEISVVNNIQIVNHDLHDSNITDKQLAKPRKLSELSTADKPLMPIPASKKTDVLYEPKFEQRCVLCKSSYRERAEQWYLENNRKPNSVVNFFRQYFNAVISWECVDTHMNMHCKFHSLAKPGLEDLEQQEIGMSKWRYRELDLAITGTLTEINDIRGMDCKNKPDLILRRAMMLDKLYARLVDYKSKRDEASMNMKLDINSILMDVYKELPDENSKKILLKKVQELRELYT